MADARPSLLSAENLTLSVAGRVLQQGLTFEVRRGEILALIGGSGCGKSTLMRHLAGLQQPACGRVFHEGIDLAEADEAQLARIRKGFGVMFQSGALWSSMTVGENVMLPLTEFAELDEAGVEQLARFKLALVGLDGAFEQMPSALSGGMKKRAAIARAMALDPPLLFLDEPSAGLDPLTSARLDDLILNLRDHLGTSIVLVTHELQSIFAVADRALFLDAKERTMTALDTPQRLLQAGPAAVRQFLRGRAEA
ncbi:ATP-binding cassette domain-containing protein [Pelomonas sp. SE-A7]|uniref:ABC transporter ATP-binding protein n=1 Tax=Pelomonas sp. SE-A7 TaxID=3054953 RepID=UPI00259CA9C7|nr:ATP-binding cassette domain-containing protein [Pelomonas sp. SE-A7]MDM4764997.1 ATP-binding cassette domain-containing protein [Pelomonas sp. SE-A7]